MSKYFVFVFLLEMIFLSSCVTTERNIYNSQDTIINVNVKIHLVKDKKYWVWSPSIYGVYDSKTNEVWILADEQNGKVYPASYYILGHEIWHSIKGQDFFVGNPDLDKHMK